jgi:hypothetical protein
MCDYSLMGVPNRLAKEGEELVIHRFPAGTLGLASPSDLLRVRDQPQAWLTNLWLTLKTIYWGPTTSNAVPAVCIPPGAQLMLQDFPIDLERSLTIGWAEEVTFTQLTAAANTHRDAVRFKNGVEIQLQKLAEGQRVKVLRLALADEFVRQERTEVRF